MLKESLIRELVPMVDMEGVILVVVEVALVVVEAIQVMVEEVVVEEAQEDFKNMIVFFSN